MIFTPSVFTPKKPFCTLQNGFLFKKSSLFLIATTAAAAIQGGSIFCRSVQSGGCKCCARLPRNVIPRSSSRFGLPLQSATCAWVVDGGVQSCGAAKTNGGRGNRDVDDGF